MRPRIELDLARARWHARRWNRGNRRLFGDAEALARDVRVVSDAIDLNPRLRTEEVGARWIITSMIRTPRQPLSYSLERSVFSHEDRLDQTIGSIRSVCEREGTQPVVLDASPFTGEDERRLRDAGAVVVAIPGERLPSIGAKGPHKGLGEALLIASYCLSRAAADRPFWKLSGRYRLTGTRPSPSLQPDRVVGVVTGDIVNMTCFGVGSGQVRELGGFLLDSVPLLMDGQSVEDVFFRFARRRLTPAGALGVAGLVAVDGSSFAI
jgi:hypothetical protein